LYKQSQKYCIDRSNFSNLFNFGLDRREIDKTASISTAKNGFVTAAKLGTTNNFFVVATKRFVDRTKHFVVVTEYFCYPYFNK